MITVQRFGELIWIHHYLESRLYSRQLLIHLDPRVWSLHWFRGTEEMPFHVLRLGPIQVSWPWGFVGRQFHGY